MILCTAGKCADRYDIPFVNFLRSCELINCRSALSDMVYPCTIPFSPVQDISFEWYYIRSGTD